MKKTRLRDMEIVDSSDTRHIGNEHKNSRNSRVVTYVMSQMVVSKHSWCYTDTKSIIAQKIQILETFL